MSNKIQVKDTTSYGILIFLIAMFPFVFLFFSLNFGYVWGVLITFFIYLLIVWAIVKYNKTNLYVIEADKDQVTLSKYGSYKWEQISKIKAVRELNIMLKPRMYLKVYFTNSNIISIDTSNFDIYGEELAQKLRKLGKLQ
jgi:Ca2+/Na+ antiporter